jgi:hypothetical protein
VKGVWRLQKDIPVEEIISVKAVEVTPNYGIKRSDLFLEVGSYLYAEHKQGAH